MIKSIGTIFVNFYIENAILRCLLHVVPNDINIPADGIIGKDFIKKYQCKIDYEFMEIHIKNFNSRVSIPILSGPSDNTIVLPARSEVVREFELNISEDSLVLGEEILPGILIPRTVVYKKVNNKTLLKIMNTNQEIRTISNILNVKTEPLSNFHIFSLDGLKSESHRLQELNKILNSKSDITNRLELKKLCYQYNDIFALKNDTMTVNNFYKQKLRIKDDTPVFIKNYRLPYSQREEVKKQVNKLLTDGLIEPSQSSYNSPIILVPKKGNGKWRMCIDYRLVNKKLIADRYPLPRIEDILDNLGRTKYFSVLDLFSGFHQIPLEAESRDITSFSTPEGFFRWKVLPFGLNVSPNSFSRMMALAFAGATPLQCFLYMDDIIVIGCSEKHHLNNLKSVFDICRKYNLKLNPEKCQFFKNEVTYLGHRCTERGILPDNSKIQALTKYPRPVDKDSVKRFTAFMNYYRKFIPHFATLAKPLNNLTRRKAKFEWTSECEESFQKLKNILQKPHILQYPDFSKEFIITVDASKIAAGAVLSQNFNDNDLPIAFASKSFTKGELNKSTIEKELTAIHYFIKYFRPYILGNHFTVRSDHKPLTYLFALKDPSSKLTRMRLDLEEFNFTVEHIRGKDNVVADALSRVTIDDLKENLNSVLAIQTRSMTKSSTIKSPVEHNNQNQLARDTNIKNDKMKIRIYEGKIDYGIPKLKIKINEKGLINYTIHYKRKIISNIDASMMTVNTKDALAQSLVKLDKEADRQNIRKLLLNNKDKIFTLIPMNEFKEACNKLLTKLEIIIVSQPKLISEKDEREQILKRYHNDPIHGGHIGQKRLYAKLKEKFYWKHMIKDIAKYIKTCDKCMLNKAKIKTREPLNISNTPQKSFDVIVIDTVGPFRKTDNGNQYALTMICDLTKFLITVPIQNKQAETVAKAIFNNCILIYGTMRRILSDRGSEYVNQISKELFKLMNIEHVTSTAYHHETLGSIERSHRVLNEYLRSYINEQQTNWDEFIKYFTYCYNITPHTSFNHKYSPFELVFARNVVSHEFLLDNKIDPIYNIDNYAMELKHQLQIAHQAAHNFLKKSKELNKLCYDKKVNSGNFNIGDKVLIRSEEGTKLDPVYKGPFIIKDIEGLNAIIVDLSKKSNITVHKNRLIKINK